MKTPRAMFATALFCLLFTQLAAAATQLRGSWTLAPAGVDHVQFGLVLHLDDGQSTQSSDWPASAFGGLDLHAPGRRDVQFAIAREAGRIDCTGYLEDGAGGGTFRFTPDARYEQSLRALGFTGIDAGAQFEMTVHDVTTGFARDMRAEKLSGLDTGALIAFAIFGVTRELIHELRLDGLPAQRAATLIAFRIHGVTPQFVRDVRKAQLSPGEDQLVAMRVHGVTPEWLEQIGRHGYDGLDVGMLLAFRIHGVTPEFIEKLEDLGFEHPAPEMLVAMRVHAVTPEYIADMKARGLANLTLDKLVTLRIQDID